MSFGELESALVRLLSFPLKNQIRVDLDQDKKIFRLSAVIFRSPKGLPPSVRDYALARKGMQFRPHHTSYHMGCEQEVQLMQEIPFSKGPQQTLRTQVHAFWQLAKGCSQMLMEIAAEERFEYFKEFGRHQLDE